MEAREKLETYQTIPHVISLDQMKAPKLFVLIVMHLHIMVGIRMKRHLWNIVKTKTIKNK